MESFQMLCKHERWKENVWNNPKSRSSYEHCFRLSSTPYSRPPAKGLGKGSVDFEFPWFVTRQFHTKSMGAFSTDEAIEVHVCTHSLNIIQFQFLSLLNVFSSQYLWLFLHPAVYFRPLDKWFSFCFSPKTQPHLHTWAGGRWWNVCGTSTTLLWHRVKQSQAFLGARRQWG